MASSMTGLSTNELLVRYTRESVHSILEFTEFVGSMAKSIDIHFGYTLDLNESGIIDASSFDAGHVYQSLVRSYNETSEKHECSSQFSPFFRSRDRNKRRLTQNRFFSIIQKAVPGITKVSESRADEIRQAVRLFQCLLLESTEKRTAYSHSSALSRDFCVAAVEKGKAYSKKKKQKQDKQESPIKIGTPVK